MSVLGTGCGTGTSWSAAVMEGGAGRSAPSPTTTGVEEGAGPLLAVLRRGLTVAALVPLAIMAVVGPRAGAASADRPAVLIGTYSVTPEVEVLHSSTVDGVTTITWRQHTINGGGLGGSSVDTWTCVIPEGRSGRWTTSSTGARTSSRREEGPAFVHFRGARRAAGR